MELAYFAIANVFVFALAIGLVWMVVGAIPADGQKLFSERLSDRVVEHFPMLGGLAVVLVGSYFIYRQLVPDIYGCTLNDGSTVNTEFNPKRAWIKVGDETIPMSRVEACSPSVVSLSQRIDRAFNREEH